jgi:signal transduction histidine kinase
MKYLVQVIYNVQGKLSMISLPFRRYSINSIIMLLHNKASHFLENEKFAALRTNVPLFFERVRSLGCAESMEDYEQRKLKVFNLLNFFQLVFGIIIPVTAMMSHHRMSPMGWVAACMPALVSVLVLYLNSRRAYEVSTLCYFILYPVITSIVYLSGMNLGIELFFILYGILAVFFIQDIGHMVFTVSLSMISYFILTVVWRNYQFQLEVNGMLYLANHFIAIIFIFFGLFLIKKENSDYQFSILNQNRLLHEQNIEIEKQKKEIAESAELLDKQAGELRELNALKNKLFSVIAHDLKSPMYALRNIFTNIEKYNLPAKQIKAIIPDVVHDLDYTTSLMENLLQWAKSQMQSSEVKLEEVDIAELADEVLQMINTQANVKKLHMINDVDFGLQMLAQQDMIRLVLRNLISNAIKFTPEHGTVRVGTKDHNEYIEVYVQDTGVGISRESLEKISLNDYFTTRGTSSEAGTGLGLMLCKDFLAKNGGTLHVTSEVGKGSRFSFMLRKIEIAREKVS